MTTPRTRFLSRPPALRQRPPAHRRPAALGAALAPHPPQRLAAPGVTLAPYSLRRPAVLVATLALLAGCAASAAAVAPEHPQAGDHYAVDGVIRGLSLEAGRRPIADEDLHPIVEAGVEWVALVPYGFQRQPFEPALRMPWTRRVMWGESDEGITETTRLATEHGLRVLLKPQVWVRDREHWVGDIAMRTGEDWDRWFAQYTEFIVHFAALAERTGTDLLSIGTELEGTIGQERRWRRVIAAVRDAYSGALTYSANWDRTYLDVPFWDDLDYIGVSAYFPVHPGGDDDSIDAAAVRAAWGEHRDSLVGLSRRVGRPVIFTEAGYRSVAGALAEPWEWRRRAAVDLQVQAAAYDALLATFWEEPWFSGLFFWNWGTHRDGGPDDGGYTPRNKPALDVMARWFERPAPPRTRPQGSF